MTPEARQKLEDLKVACGWFRERNFKATLVHHKDDETIGCVQFINPDYPKAWGATEWEPYEDAAAFYMILKEDQNPHTEYLDTLKTCGMQKMSLAIPLLCIRFPDLGFKKAKEIVEKWAEDSGRELY